MAYEIVDKTKGKMESVLSHFEEGLMQIRTGRANPNMLDKVEVDYYGSPTPLQQIASITVQEGRTLVIKPYDGSVLKDIEKACNQANLGIAPLNDGTVVRMTVPALTEDTRKQMCKEVSKHAEEAKVALRNLRRDANDATKKDDSLTEDLEKDCINQIQKLTDEMTAKVESIAQEKEKDVMTV